MKIIAIDPGYNRVGVAVLEKTTTLKEQICFSNCFETDKNINFSTRLNFIGEYIYKCIDEYKPEVLVIENLFFAKNSKTALKVSEARGVIIFQATRFNIPIYEYTPNQIKLAVAGYGNANKLSIHNMVKRLVVLEDKKMNDDEIDAIAIGLTFFATQKKI